MNAKTPGQVIKVLKADLHVYQHSFRPVDGHEIACLQRAIAIVRLWQAGITPADVRAAERKRKGRSQ